MLAHYFTTAFRNLLRHRTHTLINVVGLGIGLACFIATYMFVDYVRRTDSHYQNSARIFSVLQGSYIRAIELNLPFGPGTSARLAEALRADLPDLEAVARSTGTSDLIVSIDGERSFRQVGYVDPDFLKIFDLPFVSGSPESILSQSRAAILTEESAAALFGTQDVVGRSIELDDFDPGFVPDDGPRASQTITVAGVIEQIPEPSRLGVSFDSSAFEVLIVTAIEEDIAGPDIDFLGEAGPWLFSDVGTYVLLPGDGSVSLELLNERLGALESRVPEEYGSIDLEARHISSVALSQLDEFLFYSQTWLSVSSLILLLGGVVLATACLNFVSLATATATARTKEVGMRKVLGARRPQIVRQYLFEAGLIVVAAHLVALLVIQAALPLVNQASAMTFAIPWFTAGSFWVFLAMLATAVTLASGAYPALMLGRVRPILALSAGLSLRPSVFRTMLVGAQFAVTSFLLVGVIVILMQNAALARIGLGLSEDPYVVIQNRPRAVGISQAVLSAALLEAPQILDVMGADTPPWNLGWGGSGYSRSPEEAAEIVFTQNRSVSYDYLPSLGVELLAGRWFSEADAERSALWLAEREAAEENESGEEVVSESDEEPERIQRVILNLAAVSQFGWNDPQEAVGGIVYHSFRTPEETDSRPVEVIGVIEEAPFALMGFGYDAFVFSLTAPDRAFPIIRISQNDVSGALAHIDAVWAELVPHAPLRREFMDERFGELYALFERLSRGLLVLAGCAILITNMGLFGMAIFVTGRRQREVGVRKSVGANVSQILYLFLRDFSKPVLIANIIAWPLAYLVAQAYLNIFVQRISLTLTPFILSLIVTLLIAWVAVAGQVVGAARVKPAEILRHE